MADELDAGTAENPSRHRPLNGGFLVKTLVLSIDPYMRGRMRGPHIKSYLLSPTSFVGQSLTSFSVGRVLHSEHFTVKAGDHVYGHSCFQAPSEGRAVSPAWPSSAMSSRARDKEGLPWSVYVGVYCMPGATAHHAWHEIANAKPGETALVTAAAGPVARETVVQLSLGADVVFNYHIEGTNAILERESVIDIVDTWITSAGRLSSAALDAASAASTTSSVPPPSRLVSSADRARLRGIASNSTRSRAWSPRAKSRQRDRSVGLEVTGEAILAVYKRTNTGKKVIVVAEE
ncbi:NAD-P-binding protein [Rhodofomes roseus]|uniref:NAD-P-binding protein n=1 Tax=Rhodofomes roseus TaxID=34475 RepID=A0ABQ8K502_9APHY|nr:NAD-P-binding protein [Rhodofomes roseus]KAH9832045.1 NAD-P-binding protein [Rhodofomes roseus]